MKNSFIVSEIRSGLLRRLVLPVLIVVSALLALRFSPRENVFQQRPLNYRSHYENFYNRFLPCVRVSAEELHYTGLDYTVGQKVEGHYYYTLVDGFCQFYLLGAEAGTPPSPMLPSLDIHGRLIELEDEQYEAVVKTMAKALGWRDEALEEMTAPYAVSSLPYPFYLNLAGRLAVNLCLLYGLAELFCSLAFLVFPMASPAFCYLGGPDTIREAISAAERELHASVPLKAGKCFLTGGFFLYLDGAGTRLLPAKSIIWAAARSSLFCLMAPDGRILKFSCPSPQNAAELADALLAAHPHILTGGDPSQLSKARKSAGRKNRRERRAGR